MAPKKRDGQKIMIPHQPYRRLQELLDDSIHEWISDEGVREMEAILRRDRAAWQFYRKYLATHTLLYLHFSAIKSDKTNVASHDLVDGFWPGSGHSPILGFLGNAGQGVLAFSAAHPIFSLLLVLVVFGAAASGITVWTRSEAPPPVIAQVNEIRGCRWAEQGIRPRYGSEAIVAGQRLELETGLAEVVYRNGAGAAGRAGHLRGARRQFRLPPAG